MADRNPGEDRTDRGAGRRQWTRAAITLLLLLIVIVSGSAMIYTREQWWEMYLRLTH